MTTGTQAVEVQARRLLAARRSSRLSGPADVGDGDAAVEGSRAHRAQRGSGAAGAAAASSHLPYRHQSTSSAVSATVSRINPATATDRPRWSQRTVLWLSL